MNTHTLHAVFLKIESLGVLIIGRSGIGKSELALMLIERGHALIADDATIVKRHDDATLTGHCPELTRGLLHVRGAGLLDIKHIYGANAIATSHSLDLVIEIVHKANNNVELVKPNTSMTLLDVNIPSYTLLKNAALCTRVIAICKQHTAQSNPYTTLLDKHQLALSDQLTMDTQHHAS